MGDRGSLNSSIQSFSLNKLKKTQTNDRSAPLVTADKRDRSRSEQSIQIPSKPKLTTQASGSLLPSNGPNGQHAAPSSEQHSPPVGFRLPLQLPDRSTLRHVDLSQKGKTEEKSPSWVRNKIDIEESKPPHYVYEQTSHATDHLTVPPDRLLRGHGTKTPPSSPVDARPVSPPPPPVPPRTRSKTAVTIAVPQNPNVMLGTPTSPPVIQTTGPTESVHRAEITPPPVPRRAPKTQAKPTVIEAQAPSSPDVSRARHHNAPVEHSGPMPIVTTRSHQDLIVQHVTVHSPPFSHDPIMKQLGYGQVKPETAPAPGPATTDLPPNTSRVYQVNWRVQPDYSVHGPYQQAEISRAAPTRKLSLEELKPIRPRPVSPTTTDSGVRDRSATLPRYRVPSAVPPPPTIPTIKFPSKPPMSDYESRWNFHGAGDLPAPPAFRNMQKIYPSGAQTGNSYPAPPLLTEETPSRLSMSPTVPQVNSNPTLPTSPSTVGGKKAPPRPPKKGTGSLTLSQVPLPDGGESLVSPVSPGERKSLPPTPGSEKKLPPPLPKKQPNMVFTPPNNPPPQVGGLKKVPITAPPKKVGTAPVPPKKMVTGAQAPPPPPPKKAGMAPPLPPKKTV